MFPIAKNSLSFLEILDYWSREMRPVASQAEVFGILEQAWWLGELRGDSARPRLHLLQAMFKLLRNRNDAGIAFVLRDDAGPKITELPDGIFDVDARRQIIIPSTDPSDWDEGGCGDAFHTLAQTSSIEYYPEITRAFSHIELTYDEFDKWRTKRGYHKPTFWHPLATSQLKKQNRGRLAEYNWAGVKSQLADYVEQHSPVRSYNELWSGLTI